MRKGRKPKFTAVVPSRQWTETLAKRLGLDVENPEFSSPELTAAYVREFNRLNCFKQPE